MFFSVVLSYLPYALVTSFTPGPNNILALHTVGQKGWARGKATFDRDCRRLFFRDGGLRAGLLPAGAAAPRADPGAPFRRGPLSLLAGPSPASKRPCKGCQSPIYLWSGFFLQFVNGKIILYAITIYTGYVLPAGSGALLPIQPFVLTLFGTAGFLTWAVAGGLLQSFLRRHTRAFNGAMAAVLALCALDLLFESVAPHQIPHGFRADRATTARQATRPPETSLI
ncbi:MAG: hypothetical protein ACLR1T_07985 [Evtepia gabavorous]